MGEYIPRAPIDDEAKKYNQNLPGMGGVFNYINLHAYHYAGNNPVKLTDPNGRDFEDIWNGVKLVFDLATSTEENRLERMEAFQDYINENPEFLVFAASSGLLTAGGVAAYEGNKDIHTLVDSIISGAKKLNENLKANRIDVPKGKFTSSFSDNIGFGLQIGGSSSKESATLKLDPSLDFKIGKGNFSISVGTGLTLPLDSGPKEIIFGCRPDFGKTRAELFNVRLFFGIKL
jgi:hypothetical protein